MGKLENIQDKLNQYLRNKGLPHIKQQAKDIAALFEQSIRSVWTMEDADQRDSLVIEIAQALKPYFGGKKIEDTLDSITDKIKKEKQKEAVQGKIKEEKDKLVDLKERMKDPNYVPTFEELMKIKEGKAPK